MKVIAFSFKGKPANYSQIDKNLSRSAQPLKEDFEWLKSQGVTDVLNFRTMVVSGLEFDEKTKVESLGMRYHTIPSVTNKPTEKNVKTFLKLTNQIKEECGKLHIHCKAGADRTGMYSFIYKMMNNIGSIVENEQEWINKGHDIVRYPKLRTWAKNFLKLI